MAEQIVEDCDRASARGPWHALTFGGLTALDLLRCAIAERWQPTYATQVPPTRGVLMQWLTSGWGRDLRHAVRALKRSPGFTVVAVGTLGLAHRGERRDLQRGGRGAAPSAAVPRARPAGLHRRRRRRARISPTSSTCRRSSSFSTRSSRSCWRTSATYNSFTATPAGGRPRRADPDGGGRRRSLFPTLGVAPVLGRLPTAEDEDRVARASATRSWKTWFGGDTAVIGRSYYVGGREPRRSSA